MKVENPGVGMEAWRQVEPVQADDVHHGFRFFVAITHERAGAYRKTLDKGKLKTS